MKIRIKKNLTESRKDNITTEILKNDISGYKSLITMKLDDRTIYQELSIEKFKTKVHRDSEGLNKLQNCYPSTFQKYPPEIRKLKPWNINGNPGPGRTVVNFYAQGGPFITTYNIDFRIVNIESLTGEDFSDLDIYDEGIFGKNKLAAMSFYREIMKQIGEYVKNNPWMIYYFFGIETEEELDAEFSEENVNKRTKLYLLSLKRLQRMLDGEWVVTYPEQGNPNSIIFFKCPVSELQEMSSMGGGATQGFGAPFSKEEEKLIQEMYSTSGAMMGSGSGQIPKERNPEAHERYVRMRHEKQGLKNFKPNRYFAENDKKTPKIKIKIRKNLGERCQKGYKTHSKRKTKKMFGKTYRNCVKAEGKMSKSYCENTPCDEMGFSQRASCAKYKKCPSPKKKNEAKDPKTGTGKKPEGSGRRLYTDEDPNDTVSVKFSTVQDIKDTFSKASFKSKSHKRQSQIINLVHQRARAAYQNAKDPEVKKRLKKAYEYAEKRKEASKKKTQNMKKDK